MIARAEPAASIRLLAAALAVALAAGCASKKIEMTKPNVTRAQADRDLASCEAQASQASNALPRTPTEKAQTYNRVMLICLRARGYEVKDPAGN